MLILGLLACSKAQPVPADTHWVDEDDTVNPIPMPRLEWLDTGLSVTIDDLPGSGFDLGLAQTGTDDDTTAWFGEDCFNGTGEYHLCHGFDRSSGSLASLSGDDRRPENVVPGETTLYSEALAISQGGDDLLTYMATFDDGSCITWGNDTSYYQSFGCNAYE